MVYCIVFIIPRTNAQHVQDSRFITVYVKSTNMFFLMNQNLQKNQTKTKVLQ